MFYRKLILVLLLLFALYSLLFAEVSDTVILQRLSGHIEAIRKEYEFNRYLGGGLLIGTGVLFTGLGLVLPPMTGLDSDESMIIGGVFIGCGLGLGLGGVIALLIVTEYETLPKQFAQLPETTDVEIKEKIARGEGYLSSLAAKARNQRLLNAGITAVTGLGSLVYYFTLSSSGNPYLRDSFLYEGITTLGTAIVYFLIKSRPENENETYLAWKTSQGIVQVQHSNRKDPFIPTLIALRGGIGLAFKYN